MINDHCDKNKKLLKGMLTLNAPIATKVVCFSRLLKCLRCLYGKSADPDQTAPFSRRHFQMHFFLGAFRVKH